MNKLFTKIAGTFLGLSMAIGVGVAAGANNAVKPAYAVSNASFSATDDIGGDKRSINGDSFSFGSDTHVTVSFSTASAGTATQYWGNGTVRSYAKSTFTVSTDSGSLSSITLTYTENNACSTDVGSYSNKVWSGTSSSVIFTVGGTSGHIKLSAISATYEPSGGQSSDWVTSAIAISTSSTIAKTIYNTTDSFPTLDSVTVTKTEHDNNGVAADKNTDVTATSTLHWMDADEDEDITLPLSNGTYNIKIWASVAGETLTSKDNATPAKQYVTGTLTVTDEPQYIVVDSIVTSGNMSGNNDANTKFGLSATEWSIVGNQQNANNLPGFGSDGTTRLYGNANGGNYIVFKALKAHRSIVKASIEFNGTYSTGATVKQGEGTSGTTITASNGFYTFDEDTTAFTLVNTNSSTTQVRFNTIHIYYEDATVTTPSITLVNTPSQVGIGTNTASFTVEYENLTSNFSVSTNSTYLTASYTGAKGTGSATVYLSGVTAINSTTVSVSSTGAETQSFNVQVKVLPIVDVSLNALNWGSSTYATSPHTATWNSSYDFVVSAGQLNGGTGYLGANSGNSGKSNVSGNDWTLKGSSIDAAIVADGSASWLTHGQAVYMSNFGVVHPTEIIVNAANCSSNYTATYYFLSSTDSGDSWSVLGTGSFATATDITWTGNTYSSNSNPIQFAFVTTSSSYGTISNITIKVYGDSYATTKVLDSIYVSGTPKTSYTAGESFSLESAKVYAHYTDSITYPDEDVSSHVSFSAIAHGTIQVTITYLNKTTTVNVTVADAGDIYKKATSTGELLEGSKVVIGSTAGTSLMGEQASNNRHSESSEVYGYYDSGDVSTHSINTAEFTVGIVEENDEVFYTFKDSSDKYLYAVSSSNNYLRSSTTLTAAGKWHVEFDENVTGKALITTSVTYTKDQEEITETKYMGGNATAYGCYANSNNAISIYVDVENNVDLFVVGYMHTDIDYDADPDLPINNTGNCNSQGWYLAAKRVLVGMGSDYISEFQTNGKYTNALARYNAWALACGDTSPFTGNDIVPAQNGANFISSIFENSSSSMLIILIVSLVSVTAFGGYFLLKKKKEQ